MITMNTAGFSKFLGRLKANYEAGRDRLDPLSPTAAPKDPEMPDRVSEFLGDLMSKGRVKTAVHIPAYPASGTMPAVPARVLVVSQMGEQYFPQEEWDVIRAGGWIMVNGRLTAQAERVLAARFEDEFADPVRVAVV